MKNKLTLRLEKNLIKRAKAYAKKNGTSVSQLVADYFAAIDEEPANIQDLPPITTSLLGILKDTNIEEEDYKTHLEEKYLQ